MSDMSDLVKYVREHAISGTCRCGKCIDAGEDSQPEGHTADLIFFQVANNGATAEELKSLIIDAESGEFCDVTVFDGAEHGFIELGAWLGDQGLALMLMGLGTVLGLWKLLTPKTVIGNTLPEETVMLMACNGLVTIQAEKFDA